MPRSVMFVAWEFRRLVSNGRQNGEQLPLAMVSVWINVTSELSAGSNLCIVRNPTVVVPNDSECFSSSLLSLPASWP